MHPQNLMNIVTSAVMAFLKQGAGTGILPALWCGLEQKFQKIERETA